MTWTKGYHGQRSIWCNLGFHAWRRLTNPPVSWQRNFQECARPGCPVMRRVAR